MKMLLSLVPRFNMRSQRLKYLRIAALVLIHRVITGNRYGYLRTYVLEIFALTTKLPIMAMLALKDFSAAKKSQLQWGVT